MDAFYTRLRAAAGGASIDQIAARTLTNSEDVQRVLDGEPVGPAFLAEFCRQFDISSEWLLHGIGPMKRVDLKRFAVLQARGGDCLQSLACESDRLSRRLDDLETLIAKVDLLLRVTGEEGNVPTPSGSRAEPT